ncbi:MAG: RICIN domain-containing protein [Gammaproteobacteria bacterium]|nr:RICIN domain-containing protein [Gammaproteobacteria bacterium]
MKLSRLLFVGLTALISTTSVPAAEDLIHVRLKDRLDRPDDGYCFDILGTGSNLRLDLPLFAHNCKGGATPDSTVTYTSKGQLLFPAVGVCVTAFGVNNTVLPGTSVLVRPCDQRISFFETSNLQKFDHLENGQLRLRGSDLCLAVRSESSSTYSPFDRWRVLSLESCANTAASHSAWEMVPLK